MKLGLEGFATRKSKLEAHIDRLKVYFAEQKLLPEEKRQYHFRKVEWMDASIQASEKELSDLIAYTRRPIGELENEAQAELACAIREESEVSSMYPNVRRSSVREARERVVRAKAHIEHLSELKLSPL